MGGSEQLHEPETDDRKQQDLTRQACRDFRMFGDPRRVTGRRAEPEAQHDQSECDGQQCGFHPLAPACDRRRGFA